MAVLIPLLQGFAEQVGSLKLKLNFAMIAIALCTYITVVKVRKMRSLPPGPFGFPFVGILFSITKEFHLFLTDYIKKYGKLYSITMGRENLVILSDYKLIKKAFQNKDFTARPKSELTNLLGGYGKKDFYSSHKCRYMRDR